MYINYFLPLKSQKICVLNGSEEQVISILEFLIDKIFVSFGGTLFQQVVGIQMSTNCAPLLADLFLYSYESEFLQKLVNDKKMHEARVFNFTYR